MYFYKGSESFLFSMNICGEMMCIANTQWYFDIIRVVIIIVEQSITILMKGKRRWGYHFFCWYQ